MLAHRASGLAPVLPRRPMAASRTATAARDARGDVEETR